MITLIVSDLHLNPLRQAGTTMESRAALEEWQFEGFAKVLRTPHDRLVVNGDLFHRNSVSEKTLLRIFNLLKDEECYIVRGNHDENSERFNEICSLQLLGALLTKCTLIYDEPLLVDDMYFVPHCFNQQQFDKCVGEVPPNVHVFLHANNNNNFAVEADHSLNLSKEQRRALIAKGCHIFLGHEHAAVHKPTMTILGCLMPTSVADCLSGDKFYYTLEDGELECHVAWHADELKLMHWSEIEHTDTHFVRIIGECEVSEFPEIIRKIGDLRKKSKAFIIANAVKPRVVEKDAYGAEEVTEFNVIKLLLEQVEEEFKEEVGSCA